MKRVSCNSCRAPIFWVTMMRSGKRMPVDVTPVPGGTLIVGGDGSARMAREADAGPKFVSHFATCPKAKRHRRAP